MSDRREDVKNSYEKAKSTGSLDNQTKIFIVYNTEKTEEIKTAQCVAYALTKRSVYCIFDVEDHQAFPIGEPVTENIVKWIENSEKTLVILSKDSIKSTCQLLQTILALDKCKKKNIFCLRLLLHGVDENEIQFLKRDFLQSVPCRKLDFNKDGWEERLASYINEEKPVPEILPVGSLAHGLVFSHFNGYYRYVLPELQEQLINNDVYKNNPGRVSVHYYVLIPSTCEVVSIFIGSDNKNDITIEEETKLMFTRDHVGKLREYSITIYRIKKGDENPYYFFADCPNVLNAIHTMSEEKMAKVDVQSQVARFYHTMNEVIHHTKNKFCKDVAVELLPYNATDETMQCVLYDAIKRNLSMTDSKQQRTPHRLLSPLAQQPENDVTILCQDFPDCKDLRYAAEIAEVLVKNDIKVVKDYECGNESALKIKPAKWYILVISQTTLNSTNLTAFKCAACLDNSITDDSVSVLPVLVGVEPCEISAMIKWVTMISVTDHNYLESILQIVKGQPVRMQDKIPCGDVATGLAWANYINYLSITMEPGLRDRIVKLMKSNNVMCDCIEKLFFIVPLSCKTEPKLAEKANEKSETPVIQYVGKSEVVEKEMAGQHRTFYIDMYKYTDPETKDSVCFMSEYCAAINCIKEMGNLPFSGITREDMSRQCEKFVEVMEDIMNRKAVKNKLGDISKLVHFVFYDDSKQTLLEAIKEQIIEADNSMIYRKDIV